MLKCSRLSLPREDVESFPPLSLFLERIFSCCEIQAGGGVGGGRVAAADVVAFLVIFPPIFPNAGGALGCHIVLFCRGAPPS